MLFNAENILLIGSVLLFVSIVVSKTGYRFGVPTLLVFLLVGMFFGSDGLGLQFHNAGEAQFIGMVALSIILFSGGMDTKFAEIRPVLPQGILLSTVGVLLTTLFTGLFIYWISGFKHVSITMSLITAMLLAATMSSTDSASVFNILRSQSMNLKHNLRPMLELESGSNDPMAYMLTIVLIQFINSSGMGFMDILGSFCIQFIVGVVCMSFLGFHLIFILNRPGNPIQLLSLLHQEVTGFNLVLQSDAVIHTNQNRFALAQHIAGHENPVVPHPVRFVPCRADIDFFRFLFQFFVLVGVLDSERNLPLEQRRRKNRVDNAFHNHTELFINEDRSTVSTHILIGNQYNNRASVIKLHFDIVLVVLDGLNLLLKQRRSWQNLFGDFF